MFFEQRHVRERPGEVHASDKLALKIYPDDLRTVQTKLLQAVVKRGKAVLDEVRKAETGRVDARLDIQTWKDECNAARWPQTKSTPRWVLHRLAQLYDSQDVMLPTIQLDSGADGVSTH